MRRESAVKKEHGPMLRVRKKVKRRKPSFSRQETGMHGKLKDSWRRPRGRHSKLRKGKKSRGGIPKAGYGSPRETRGLTRQGYREVRVSSPKDLERMNPKEEAALISSAVGKKKREEIIKKAEGMKIRVLNPRPFLRI
jgi:large subunit ribosomal protein L32e